MSYVGGEEKFMLLKSLLVYVRSCVQHALVSMLLLPASNIDFLKWPRARILP